MEGNGRGGEGYGFADKDKRRSLLLSVRPKKEREQSVTLLPLLITPFLRQKMSKKQQPTLDLNTFPLRGDILHLRLQNPDGDKEAGKLLFRRRSRMKLETPI